MAAEAEPEFEESNGLESKGLWPDLAKYLNIEPVTCCQWL